MLENIETDVFVSRKNALDRLIQLKDKDVIKIVTGIRRCGKSTLLQLFIEHLLQNGIKAEQIIFINLEDYENKKFRNPDELYLHIKGKLQFKKMYVFLDEIQRVNDFADLIDGLYVNKKIDLYLTGSNSHLLSSEIATYISGRYIEIKLMPFSFREFLMASKNNAPLISAYNQYIQTSSFPYVCKLLDTPEQINPYLEGIYNTIVVKDIIDRKRASDTQILQSITQFLFDNIGLEVSVKKIADTLTSNNRKTDFKTVEKYVSALEESFIIYKAKRYNIKGKEYLKTLEKYYVADIGLRNYLLGKKAMDVGHILENVIFLELLNRGYKVFVGKLENLEVDFVAQSQNGNLYIQVAASVRSEETLKRELKPLQMINDNYPKLILTLDEDPDCDYDGIVRTNALQWLLE